MSLVNPGRSHDLCKSIVTLFVETTPLTRASSPVEVMGFEPTASTLRMSTSRPFDQGLSYDLPGSGVSIPSGSLTIPRLPARSRHVKTRPDSLLSDLFMDRCSRPIGRLKQSGAHLPSGLMTTITLLGEREAINGPEAPDGGPGVRSVSAFDGRYRACRGGCAGSGRRT